MRADMAYNGCDDTCGLDEQSQKRSSCYRKLKMAKYFIHCNETGEIQRTRGNKNLYSKLYVCVKLNTT